MPCFHKVPLPLRPLSSPQHGHAANTRCTEQELVSPWCSHMCGHMLCVCMCVCVHASLIPGVACLTSDRLAPLASASCVRERVWITRTGQICKYEMYLAMCVCAVCECVHACARCVLFNVLRCCEMFVKRR